MCRNVAVCFEEQQYMIQFTLLLSIVGCEAGNLGCFSSVKRQNVNAISRIFTLFHSEDKLSVRPQFLMQQQ